MWQVVLRQYLVPLSLSFILLRFKECLLFWLHGCGIWEEAACLSWLVPPIPSGHIPVPTYHVLHSSPISFAYQHMFTQMVLVMYKHAHYCLLRELNKYGGVCGLQMYNMHAWVTGIYGVLLSTTLWTVTPTLDRKIMSHSVTKLYCTLGFNERHGIPWPYERFSASQGFNLCHGVLGNSLVQNRKVKVRGQWYPCPRREVEV